MRDWGVVAPHELRRIVIVSPHLDDGVISLGASMAVVGPPGGIGGRTGVRS